MPVDGAIEMSKFRSRLVGLQPHPERTENATRGLIGGRLFRRLGNRPPCTQPKGALGDA
jgi:hypothetical protein